MYILRTDDRPTSHFGKFRTAISRQRVIRSTSCLVLVGFLRSVDRMDLLPVGPNPRWPPSWKISNDHISGMSYPIHFHELVYRAAWRNSLQEKIMREGNQIGHNLKYFLFWSVDDKDSHFKSRRRRQICQVCSLDLFINYHNCIGLSRYIAITHLPIIAVFVEYLRQFLIDLNQIHRHSSVPKNSSP